MPKAGQIIKPLWRVCPDTGCWLWLKPKPSGYGTKTYHGRTVLAHRWAWEHWRGPIPDGMVVDHVCNVRNCVNIMHLELVTPSENVRRAWERGSYKNRKHGGFCSPDYRRKA